jgi:hypothetical protein
VSRWKPAADCLLEGQLWADEKFNVHCCDVDVQNQGCGSVPNHGRYEACLKSRREISNLYIL